MQPEIQNRVNYLKQVCPYCGTPCWLANKEVELSQPFINVCCHYDNLSDDGYLLFSDPVRPTFTEPFNDREGNVD